MNAEPTLRISLFGGGRAYARDEPIKFPKRATAFALLAMLIARFGQPVSRTYLAFTLFPDADEEGALKELRRYLYLTAKALPQPDVDRPWFVVDQETVRWNEAAAAFVDVREFERLGASEATYGQAVDLYAGDLLEDLYDDWIVVERERLRARNLAMLQALVERHRAARDHVAAVAYAKRLLAFDPLREDVVRQVMAVRYAAGDSSGALAEFERFARRLRDDVGVAPMSETVALRETILRERPLAGSVDRVSLAASAASRPQAHRLPFVGREDELARLIARWDRAARGFGNSTFVGGEAGVGKTRLVGELARIVEAQGGRVYSGGTSSTEAIPYQCLVEAIRAALPVLASNPPDALTLRVLARALPELETTANAAAPLDALEPDREATRLFGAFAAAIESLASPRPLLLVLEDVHWASASTIDALATIARRIDRARVMIVATYREEESSATHPLRRLANALGIERRMTDLHLKRFDRNDVRRALAGAGSIVVDEAIVDRLYATSEGNALFLVEALADVVEDGSTSREPRAASSGIEALVAARIERLSDAARSVAEIAATCGDGCTVDIVRDVAGYTAGETLDALGELLDRRLVREAGARERFEYVFAHHLIGAAIYRGMADAARIRRHALVARALERTTTLGIGEVRELARHFTAAGLDAPAARYHARAARDAASVYANDDAVAFATQAIERTDDDALRVEALFTREEANARLGRRDAQERDLERLLALVDTVEERCRALRRVVLLRRAGDDRASEARAVEALARTAAASGDPMWRAIASIDEAKSRIAIGKYAEGKALAARVQDEVDPTTHAHVEASSARVDAEIALGEFEDAERSIAAMLERGRIAGDRAAICDALFRRTSAAIVQHRFGIVAQSAREMLEQTRIVGDRIGEARALMNVALGSFRISRWEDGRTAHLAGLAISEEIGDRYGLARAQMNLGVMLTRCCDHAGARALMLAARTHQAAMGDRRAVTVSLINEGLNAHAQGDVVAAKRLATEALVAAREMGHVSYVASATCNLGAAERDLGDLDAAIAHLEEGLASMMRLDRADDFASDRTELALAHAMRGDFPAALACVEPLLEIDRAWAQSEMIPASTVWNIACVLHRAGDPRAGATLAWASELALSFAASIDSPDLRYHYEHSRFFGEIARARDDGAWPAIAPPAVAGSG